jgi:hypothetical protein
MLRVKKKKIQKNVFLGITEGHLLLLVLKIESSRALIYFKKNSKALNSERINGNSPMSVSPGIKPRWYIFAIIFLYLPLV